MQEEVYQAWLKSEQEKLAGAEFGRYNLVHPVGPDDGSFVLHVESGEVFKHSGVPDTASELRRETLRPLEEPFELPILLDPETNEISLSQCFFVPLA